MSPQRFGVALILLGFIPVAYAQSDTPLKLEKTIPMPGVEGRIDHLFFDAPSGRLFVAALGNNTVEVIDVRQGRRVHSITGLHEPQGILYLSGRNRLYVANGDDGSLRVFDGGSYQQVLTARLGDDADNIRWDAAAKRIYVGYGTGALAILDEQGSKVAEVGFDAHPESFRLEANGPRIFVNLPGSHKIAVVDRNTKSIIANWSTGGASANYPMALDEADHRLFVVCRTPAKLLVFDTAAGRIIGNRPVVGDSDDVFYDPAARRIYASGGEGTITVFQQEGPDEYRAIANVPTRKGARTSLFSPESHCLYVAARRQGSDPAAIYVYHAQP